MAPDACPGGDGQARPWRAAADVRRKHALRLLDVHAGLEPAQARAALRGALRGTGADRLRAGRHRHSPEDAQPVDPAGQHPPLLLLDQGRGRAGVGEPGTEVHRRPGQRPGGCGRAGPADRRGLHRPEHDHRVSAGGHHLGRRDDADDGGPRHQEPGRAEGAAHRRGHLRHAAPPVHAVPAPGADRERGRRVRLQLPVQHPGHGGRRGHHRVLRARTPGPTGATSPTGSSAPASW